MCKQYECNEYVRSEEHSDEWRQYEYMDEEHSDEYMDDRETIQHEERSDDIILEPSQPFKPKNMAL
jgi:hypothetical protein